MGCPGEGFKPLSPQLTSDPHLTQRTGGATRIISRETSCQVQPGRGPRRLGSQAFLLRPRSPLLPCPPPPPPHPQDPGVLAPSFLPPEAQPLTPGGSAWDIIHAHFESGVGVSGRQGSVGVEECVCACWERPGRSWLVLRTRGSGPGSPPGPALSCNSFSPVHSSTSCGIRETEELQLPWALGQAGRGWVGWPPHRLLGVVVSSPKTTDDRFDQREAWRCWG